MGALPLYPSRVGEARSSVNKFNLPPTRPYLIVTDRDETKPLRGLRATIGLIRIAGVRPSVGLLRTYGSMSSREARYWETSFRSQPGAGRRTFIREMLGAGALFLLALIGLPTGQQAYAKGESASARPPQKQLSKVEIRNLIDLGPPRTVSPLNERWDAETFKPKPSQFDGARLSTRELLDKRVDAKAHLVVLKQRVTLVGKTTTEEHEFLKIGYVREKADAHIGVYTQALLVNGSLRM